MEVIKKEQLIPDKIIAGPVSLPPIPGKAPMTSNTKENSENVMIKEMKFKIKDIINRMKAKILSNLLFLALKSGINNKPKTTKLNTKVVIIGRAIHPALPLVGFLGTKLSKADNKALASS